MRILLALIVMLFLGGCFSHQKSVSLHQTALQWHQQIYKDINNQDLDKADDDFTSLEVEYPNSPFVAQDLLILAHAHKEFKEFTLAEFYLKEYQQRYASLDEKKWALYKRAEYRFFSLHNAYTNQKHLYDTLNFIKKALQTYPNSPYKYELKTMQKKLEASIILFNNQIAKLYQKLDKPKAAQIYQQPTTTDIIPPQIPWYKRIFYW
ncbi:MAG: outer membrane protein assembly factor BamD [Epsilonproteobacteria bacterium]|nr:outer membrane protein assembly factor BamD [Campylobacterota bacterium]